MKKALTLSLIILIIFSCTQDRNLKTEPHHFITTDIGFALKIRNLESLENDIRNNDLIALNSSTSISNPMIPAFNFLKYLETDQDLILGFTKAEIDAGTSFQLITKFHDSLLVQDSINLEIIAQFDYKNTPIIKRRIDTDTLFTSVIDSFLVSSNTKAQLERLIENTTYSQKLNDLIQVGSVSNLSIYMVSKTEYDSVTIFNPLKGNTVLDTDIFEDHLNFSGITKLNDSIPGPINYVIDTQAKENTLASIIPNESRKFVSYTFNDFSKILTNYEALNKSTSSTDIDDIKDLIIEIGRFEITDKDAFAIRSIDTETVKAFFNGALKDTFRQIDIYELSTNVALNSIFEPFTTPSVSSHFFVIEDFMVFTETSEDAQYVITNFTNKTTLGNTDVYKNVKEKISDESSMLIYSLSPELDSIISNTLPDVLTKGLFSKNLGKDHAQLLQVIMDNGFAHVNMLIQESKNRARTNSISEAFNIKLDNELLNDPQIVKNHVTGQKDIVVQDIENNLYMISNRGNILWKKKINGPILGDIQQIDIYKNGRLQLVFATPKEVYVLDRNGINVAPFPLKFNDEITQPLSVFDYDNKRDYRLMVVQGKNILLYNGKGKTVRGFNFKKANEPINSQPKHFRVGNKDYIVFGTGNKMHILNRRGQSRINVREKIDFSDNEIYLYKNNFTTTNAKGELIQVNQKGQLSKQDLMLSEEHDLTATSKTIATLLDNTLTIRSKSVELDFGEYTAPKIFYLRDKIYVSVTDLQTQRVYLFDSQAKSIPNFPVYGNSSIELIDIDKDKNLEFVVKGDSHSIILYQLN
jgi:hypothetical protein